uniref:Myelin protein zero like 2 n=1 Tax=Laticauda laticaudata TaxID=8630 RepID=A0A8C5SEB5_LATLA
RGRRSWPPRHRGARDPRPGASFSLGPVAAMETFTPGTLEALNGTDVRLKCTFRSPVPAGPKLTVSWSFQSELKEPLEAVSRFLDRITWDGNVHKNDASVMLHNVSPKDNGTFQCHVKNPPDVDGIIGEIRLSVVLKSECPAPSPPCLLPHLTKQPLSCLLTCSSIEAEGRRRGKGDPPVRRGGPSVLVRKGCWSWRGWTSTGQELLPATPGWRWEAEVSFPSKRDQGWRGCGHSSLLTVQLWVMHSITSCVLFCPRSTHGRCGLLEWRWQRGFCSWP